MCYEIWKRYRRCCGEEVFVRTYECDDRRCTGMKPPSYRSSSAKCGPCERKDKREKEDRKEQAKRDKYAYENR
ncbi:uncharacterized protein RAG0_06249 [Rhynchosporium agropyri]|uniref:Uncharacterized protein n=1 Tax=Rhynchosporium agropyri TaxID=914238 RepID=A0A1E1KGD8_9HELO|nr:uncharacterized protein RAG0_06249 [Rhynchosporium agropyri]